MTGNEDATLHRVAVGGVDLSYVAVGDEAAAPMLLLHALGEDSGDWHSVMPRLARTHRVFALDMRGHGISDHPGSYSFELMRDDVIGFLDAAPALFAGGACR